MDECLKSVWEDECTNPIDGRDEEQRRGRTSLDCFQIRVTKIPVPKTTSRLMTTNNLCFQVLTTHITNHRQI